MRSALSPGHTIDPRLSAVAASLATSTRSSPVTKPHPPRQRGVTPKELSRFCLTNAARRMGLAVIATKGAGKSRYLGRLLAYDDFQRRIPLVIIDPLGGTIDNFLDKVARLPEGQRRQAWQRIRY